MTTPLVPGLSPRDSQILELLRGGASVQRVIDIGRHRKSWNVQHVGAVVAYHWTYEKEPEPEPSKYRPTRKVAECGTISGHQRHLRLNEKPCADCLKAKREYEQKLRKAKQQPAPELGPEDAVWRPEPYTGRATDVRLSPAQLDVLDQLCKGMSNGRIGIALGITENTVKSHVKEILAALGAIDRAHAVVRVHTGQVRVLSRPRTEKAA